MSGHEWAGGALILMGAAVMALALRGLGRVLPLAATEDRRREWRRLRGLAAFFLVGYLGALGLLLAGAGQWLGLLTGLVFFLGAVFVYLVVDNSLATMREALRLHQEQANARAADEKAAELEAINRKLEERGRALERTNAELDQFAAVVTHDLMQPVQAMLGYLELLQASMGEAPGPESRAALDSALATTERMDRLVRDILALARSGASGWAPEPVELDDVVDEALANLQARLQGGGAEVVRGPMPRVMGHRGHLVRLFQNLVDNALKYRGEAPPVVRLGAERKDGEWEVSVADNGPGIPADERLAIFEMFRRGEAGQAHPGSGLGLALSRKIVERHGGRIRVESEPGRGAAFLFTLPAAGPA